MTRTLFIERLTTIPLLRLREGVLVLALAVGIGLLVALAGLRAPTVALPVDALSLDGPAITAGIYARETHPDGYVYRWTSGSAVVQLRGAFNAAPAYVASARLRPDHPTGAQPLTLALQGRDVATITPAADFRTYHVLVQPDPALDHELWLNLRTPSFVAAENPRPLGVILTDLQLRPLTAPDWAGAWFIGLGVLALWVGLRLVGVAPRDALVLALIAGLSLAAAAAIYRPTPQPYAALAAVALIGVWLAGWIAHHSAARYGLAALTILVAFAGVIWPSWLSDDALISYHYAQNLAAGYGLVYNVGERVEGYTNFLWTVLFAAIITLGGDPVAWSYILGAALAVAIVLLTYALGARLRTPAVGLLAALIVATSQSLLLYTSRGSGLETGLFTLLILAGVARYLTAAHRPWPLAGAGLLFALAALTRPEGALVFGLTGVHLAGVVFGPRFAAWIEERRTTNDERRTTIVFGLWSFVPGRQSPMRWFAGALVPLSAFAAAFLLIFLPYFLWRVSYYGDLLPNTFYAKTGGGLRQVVRGARYAGGFALTLGGPLLLLIGVPWWRNWRAALASWRGYLLPLTLAYTVYIIAVGGDHFRGERFFVPLLPWFAILLADGLELLLARGSARVRAVAPPSPLVVQEGKCNEGNVSGGTGFLRPVLTGLLITVFAGAALLRTAPIDITIRGLDESVWIWREIGWWVADNGPPDASIAAEGAGAPAYYSRRTTIDMLGLTNRHIARVSVPDMGAGVAGHEKRDPDYVLNTRQPTYIPQIWEAYFGGASVLNERYRQISVLTRSGRELQLWERRP
jgi:arabinofuranosyltransferase